MRIEGPRRNAVTLFHVIPNISHGDITDAVFEYKEIVGISTESVEAAVQEGLNDISQNYQVAWFEVISIRGRMVDASTTEYQVTVKIGCRAK